MHRGPLHIALLRAPVTLFVISVFLFEFPGARDLIESPYSGIETQNLAVQNVAPWGPNTNAGIHRGDVILRVAGERVRNYDHLRHIVRSNSQFLDQEYVFLRDGAEVALQVHYVRIPASIVYRRFAFLLVGFTFLIMGLLVFVRRTDTVGILFSLNCTMLAFFLADRPVYALPIFQLFSELFYDAVMLFFPAVFLHFFLVFPERPTGGRHASRWRIYSVPIVLYAAGAWLTVKQFFGGPSSPSVLDVILALSTVYLLAYVIASLIIFGRSYRSSAVAQKVKLRIAIAGTIFGIIPFTLMTVWRQVSPGTNTLWEFLSVVALAFVSVSFAYAILKHGAIELNIVVRKSLAYAFLTGAVIAAYYALINLIGDYFTREFNLRPAYFSMISVLVLAVIFAPARDVVQRVVDRMFFRGDYDLNQEVVEFNRGLSSQLTRREALVYFASRIEELLKTSFIAFYITPNSPGRWSLADTFGQSNSLPHDFPSRSLLGRYLKRYRRPLMVEYLDYSWGRRNLDAESTAFLNKSRAAVCLPVGTQGSIPGLIVLGPKRSGLLYNRTDADLLGRATGLLGLVLENATLHEAAIEQERLKNEVLLARDIQLSLLPDAPPVHQALEIIGKMVTSEEVGGDYFDYFELDQDRIGIAIGDVQGKGIPAAMLVSSLQAVFKSVALKNRMRPAAVIDELNRFMHASPHKEQFATFFYGIVDLSERTFAFSSAGHCPALLIREKYVDRLGEGGMMLGVQDGNQYQEGRVRIGPGEILFLYTDGLTEQTAAESTDQFGEARLIEFLTVNKNRPLSELQEWLFATILAYGGGQQDDDHTSIIARLAGD